MEEIFLHLDKLDVGYGGHPVIKGINVSIKKGEIVTLIGPNGAGKSTIIKSIIRQIPLVGGAVLIAKKAVGDYSYKEFSQTTAVVLTERIRPELMSCRDVVAMGRFPYTGRLGMLDKEDEEKVESAMRQVHAEEIADKDFNETSDGQKQRVLLARAICQEPALLILDEPTSFLDIRYKLELLSILRDMAREKNITVLMSLHEIDLAMKISDRMICVKGDHIFLEGNPEEVLNEGLIRELYGIDNGFFDPLYGSLELARTAGAPQVFVISDTGRGIPVYRKLQKEGIPFAAGILYENDMDFRMARLLAQETIVEKAFAPISGETFEKAVLLMDRCPRVIDAGVSLQEVNQKNGLLLELAKNQKKYEKAY